MILSLQFAYKSFRWPEMTNVVEEKLMMSSLHAVQARIGSANVCARIMGSSADLIFRAIRSRVSGQPPPNICAKRRAASPSSMTPLNQTAIVTLESGSGLNGNTAAFWGRSQKAASLPIEDQYSRVFFGYNCYNLVTEVNWMKSFLP